jgi:CcmD family protein
MDEPAQTLNYFIAGYSVIFIGLLGYLVSLYLRWKKLLAEKKLLEERE